MQNKSERKVNIPYIIISILVAVGIWIYVDNTEGYKVTVAINDLPIEYLGKDTTLADRGLMLQDDSDQTVSLKLEGTRKVLMKLDPEKIRVQANLSDVTSTGVQNISYKIIYPSTEFSNSLSVKVNSYTVKVDIGKLYSKDIEIRCDIQGAVADGYIAGKVQFLPETLEVRGQQAEVDTISYAKVVLKIDNATETVTQTLSYQFYDKDDQQIDPDGVRATADKIQVTLPVNIIKKLPLTMNFIESSGSSLSNVNYTITPSTISVAGPASVLKDVDSIVLDDFSLADLNGATTYNYLIPIPDSCENLSDVTRATLKISFKDLSTTTQKATKFECENSPEGKTVTVLTKELEVKLRGTSAAVAAVRASDLTVVADLKDVNSASGSYTIPATIQVGTGGDVGAVGTYQIKITISDTASDTTGDEG